MNLRLHKSMQLVPVPARALALFLRRWLICTLMLAVAIALAIGFSLAGTWLGTLTDTRLLANLFQFAGAAVAITGVGVYLTGTGMAARQVMHANLGIVPRQV